jgi:fucose permease
MLGGTIAIKFGWQHAFGLVALPGMIVAVLFLFVKDYKTVDLSFIDKSSNKVKMERKDIIKEFINKPSIIYTYFGIAAVIFVTTAMLTWLPSYFEKMYGMEQDIAGHRASYVMMLAIVGAPVGGYLTDKWLKTRQNARLLYPAVTTLLAAIVLFVALNFVKGSAQYVVLLVFGILVLAFVSGAVAVTQDVIHPGLRATSYAIAVVIQNLLGASTSPIIIGKIYDLTNIKTALGVLPAVLFLGALLFWIGSRHYVTDFAKVAKINLEPAA